MIFDRALVNWTVALEAMPNGDPLLVGNLENDNAVFRPYMARFVGPDQTRPDFEDDDGNQFESHISDLAAAEISLGCNPPANTEFCPREAVTRGEMAAFLVRAFGFPEVDGDNFTDDDSSVFETDIEALAAVGVTLGCNPPENDEFCPDTG